MLRKYTKLAKDLEAMLKSDPENQELKSKLENTKAVAHYYGQFIASKKPLSSNFGGG